MDATPHSVQILGEPQGAVDRAAVELLVTDGENADHPDLARKEHLVVLQLLLLLGVEGGKVVLLLLGRL